MSEKRSSKPFGAIRRVETAEEAKREFTRVAGKLAAVIWSDPNPQLRKLTPYQRETMGEMNPLFPYTGTNRVNYWRREYDRSDVAIQRCLDQAWSDLRTLQGYTYDGSRQVWFYRGDFADPRERVSHRDDAPTKMLHRHIMGKGMKLYQKADGSTADLGPESYLYEPPQVWIDEQIKAGNVICQTMAPGEVIVFDDTMLHESNTGPRFRYAIG